ncbi:TylF/MycF/NovP-related O-methyltransferase [Nocardioides sp. SYSU D00038]|uniref:TylF/MycF/NovP-related O-methyltransferase n=1 Tax=Nocardioides sp. SYSU D00038 TaxID=2812554 RepID=UPI001967BAF9|nr:TylF/MycF/NovP-related O-methyltransferase [Nocardioides sp. SYSU D00038]
MDAPSSLPSRVRRRLARATPTGRRLAETEAQLARARAELRDARGRLKQARSRITEARHDLPTEVDAVIDRVREERLTFLSRRDLRNLAALARDVEARGVPGEVIEAGAALGGSAIVLAAAKAPERPMRVYDVFDMIPAPSERDGDDVHRRYETIRDGQAKGLGGDVYYGYREDLLAEVSASFARLGVPPAEHRVELVKGLFEETITGDGPVALAHLDGDWYDSTMTCLERIAPRLSPGGRLVLDDYYAWSGCRRAVDDYFRGREGYALQERARLHVVRRG